MTTRVTTAVRFPPELHAPLRQAASERGLSVNHMVNEAVREFLGRLVPAEEYRLTRSNNNAEAFTGSIEEAQAAADRLAASYVSENGAFRAGVDAAIEDHDQALLDLLNVPPLFTRPDALKAFAIKWAKEPTATEPLVKTAATDFPHPDDQRTALDLYRRARQIIEGAA